MRWFASNRRDSVASLGETRLLAEIGRWLGNAAPCCRPRPARSS
jgi:hypothetical protein